MVNSPAIEKARLNPFLAALAAALSGVAIFLAASGHNYTQIKAGGPTLRALLTGRGDPTVVLEGGAGAPLESWVRVQPAVSKFARTFSYDRLGNGLSGQGALPRDGKNIALELHAALRSAGLPPPYILAGHSLGGPYCRIFAGIYPNEVAGIVLVDPTQEDLIAWAKARHPEKENPHPYRPYDEVDCAPATFAQARENPLPLNMPILLISGQGPRDIPGFLPGAMVEEVLKDQREYYPAKLKFYREWLAPFPNSRLIVTRNSGHGIPYEEPELVVQSIRSLIEQIRRR